MGSNTTYVVGVITFWLTGTFLIVFLPSGAKVFYFLFIYPAVWGLSGYLAYRYYQEHKEKNRF